MRRGLIRQVGNWPKNDDTTRTERSKTDRNILKLSLRKDQASIKRALVVHLRCTTPRCINIQWFKTTSLNQGSGKNRQKKPLKQGLLQWTDRNKESVDFGLIHGFKSIHNALEVETHTPKGMPEMALKEEESKVEMSVCQTCTSSVSVSYTHLTLPTKA